LGLFPDDQERLEKFLASPDGIVLVTGPTGSGKTTTLYSCLNFINQPDRKIITVEEPIEYRISGINQVQVNGEVGLTFPVALRSILRQAPNIIMIGEIRDLETATIAMNASLTGHLVFSTLHTNDAPSAVPRLIDLGLQPFLVTSAVRAIIAQRLVRRLCPNCKKPGETSQAELNALLRLERPPFSANQVMGPVGCDHCRQTGYKGRTGIFEIFAIDDEARRLINTGCSIAHLRRHARQLCRRDLFEDGVGKVLAGLTSVEEILATMVGSRNR
jgi:type II secretory ATPase GspE/PulE/Tfp pilus assembly ATPase PilB-like protein